MADRRLLTILFTDVEGSTAMRSAKGDSAAQEILRTCDDLIREQVETHGGRAIKSLGDGLMASFESPSRAVSCALAVQRELTDHALRQPRDEVRVRLGLHTGEVAEEAGDLFGAAVNAAARIAAKAKGGEILASEVVRQLCAGVEDAAFEDRGRVTLKGFPERWRLCKITSTGPAVQPRPGQRTPFVGREAERAELRELIERAFAGEGGLVMIGGEPGVGKSRFSEEMAAEGLRRGMRVFTGHSYEGQSDLPYMPWVEILEAAFRETSPTVLRETLGDSAPEIARIVPELRRLFPDIPPPLELPPDQQRRYTLNSIREYATRVARLRPQLYVLEDLHWADEGTLLFLESFAERLPTIPCLVVGTYRDLPIEISPVLGETLAALVRRRQARLVSLKRHSEDEVAAMLQVLSGHPPPKAVTAAIFAETEGNAFFVEEIFGHLADSGRLLDERGRFRTDISLEALDVPANVRLVTGRRLDRLGDATHGLLLVAAVAGRRTSFQLLEALGELTGDALLDALDEAERARIVMVEPSSHETYYWFAHELIRQTLLARLSPPRRKRIHLRIADALERVHADEIDRYAADIAYHLVSAAEVAERDRTARYLIRAGERSLGAAAFEDALRHFANALAVLPAVPTRQRADILGRVGLAQRSLCRWQDAVATWDEAVAVLEALGEAEAAADLAWEYGFHLAWQYRPKDILTVTHRALAALEGKRPAPRCRVLAMMGMGFSEDGQFGEAAARLDEARKLAETEGDTRLLGEVGTVETIHHAIWMQFRESEPAGRRAAAMLREAGALWNLADALAFLDQALVFQGKFAESDAVVEEAVPLAERVGHYAAASVLGRRNGLAKHAARSGSLKQLEEMAATQFVVSTDMGSAMWLAHANAFRGMVLLWQGDWETARTFLEEGARLAPPGLWFGPHHGLLLLLHAHLGDADGAYALLDSVALPVTGQANMIGTWTLGLMAAEAVSILGHAERARALYPMVCEALDTGAVMRQFDGALLERVAGMAASTGGLDERAEEHFERALRQATELPHMIGRPMVRWSYGTFLLDRGRSEDAARAVSLLDEAVAEFRSLGMPRHEAMAAEALRRGASA